MTARRALAAMGSMLLVASMSIERGSFSGVGVREAAALRAGDERHVKHAFRWPLLALALVTAACTSSSPGSSVASSSGSSSGPTTSPNTAPTVSATALAKQVCADNSREVLLRTWHGYFAGRSGDIQLIPTYPNFINGGLTHSTPYDYTQEVPLFLYGRGYVKAGVYPQPVTLADVAPTSGRMVGFNFHAPDGTAQTQALIPQTAGKAPPRLVVTMVWDSGGMDVLNRWPKDWPYLKSLQSEGAWFTHATVGASPSNTPTGHATIGTGAFPDHHGMADEYIRVNGVMQKPNANGPAFMVDPTLADLYDLSLNNRPLIGGIATLSAHLMMVGHGSDWSGGDKDIAVARERQGATTGGDDSAVSWNLTTDMAPFYTLPSYVNQLPGIGSFNQALDRMDGKIDGMWRDNSIAQLHNGFDTPARTPFQTQLIEKVIQQERFGADSVPDLLYLNYKAIDTIGHAFSADGPEMSDAVKVQDQNLREFVDFLNATVGKGKWVLVLTADHGTQRDPAVSGAFMIDIDRFTSDLEREFDTDGDNVALFTRIRPTEIWVNPAELADNRVTLNQISGYISGLTQAETIRVDRQPDPSTGDQRVFSAAFPSSMLSKLPCLPEARQGS